MRQCFSASFFYPLLSSRWGLLSFFVFLSPLVWAGWSLGPSATPGKFGLFFIKDETTRTEVATLTPKLEKTDPKSSLSLTVGHWVVTHFRPSSIDIRQVKILLGAGNKSGVWDVKTKNGHLVYARGWKEEKGYGYPFHDKIVMEFKSSPMLTTKELKLLGQLIAHETDIPWQNQTLVSAGVKKARIPFSPLRLEDFDDWRVLTSLSQNDCGYECKGCFDFHDLNHFGLSLPKEGWALGTSENGLALNLFFNRMKVGTLEATFQQAGALVSNEELARWGVSNLIPSFRDMHQIKEALRRGEQEASWVMSTRRGEEVFSRAFDGHNCPGRPVIRKAFMKFRSFLKTSDVETILRAIPNHHNISWKGVNPAYTRVSMDNFDRFEDLESSAVGEDCQGCFDFKDPPPTEKRDAHEDGVLPSSLSYSV